MGLINSGQANFQGNIMLKIYLSGEIHSSKIWFAKSLILFSVVLASCNPAPKTETETQSSKQTDKPNVVFILVDDMGFGDVGYNGGEIATPNLDQMAQTGTVLARNYVYPICSPTRAALMTGRSPLEFGIDAPISNEHTLPLDTKIMPEYFSDLGYQTALVGKWHLGIGRKSFFPHNRGFDYFYGFLGGWVDFYTHTYDEGLDWQRNGKSVREEGYATDLLTADAKRVITSRDADKPLFLYLSYNSPHFPLQITPREAGLNSNVEAGDRRVYAEMVTDLDAAIGDIIKTLKAEGIYDNTILVFSSDNGGAPEYSTNITNAPLRGSKGTALEGGIRVPGLMSWPDKLEGGKTLDQMVVVHDWLPTLLDAVDGNPQDIEKPYGQSMWSAIESGDIINRKPIVIGAIGTTAVFDGPWKLTEYKQRGPNGKTITELYNVELDPTETNDLKSAEPEIFSRLIVMKNALPRAESIRNRGPRPTPYFKNKDGDGWDYNVRIEEARDPWAESAKE